MSDRSSTTGARIWEQDVILPTYRICPPDRNPMFLEKRVYQGSSGKVYPNPFTDRVSTNREDKKYRAVFLENEFVRLMILPEIGGRIHVGQDKTNGCDFFYRQNVIKPALVGLLGPWISGGVEFNWPQHHRPSTFMPVQYEIERADDGSCTVWLSEHDPMSRMKGMVGICLHPHKAFVEAKVRLYNRTPFVQTFLWWANVGIRVHDQYQAFFPPDVTFVADHAKRAVSSFPIARNFYCGVDYTRGVDLRWYKNIPVPTSYMVTRSKYDFFGGYDHGKKAGLVHIADRHIAPGKKLWTWGNAEFGYAWDRNLTDSDGPYIELMAGVFTDNQPDFSFLQPFETKSFSPIWYPIQEIGIVKNANRVAAVNLEKTTDTDVKLGVCVTEPVSGWRVLLTAAGKPVFDRFVDLRPGQPFVHYLHMAATCEQDLLLRLLDAEGRDVIRYQPEAPRDVEIGKPATEPPPPAEIASADQLYITGLHLQQHRHATRSPEPYWQEALRRDPLDARSNNAVGLTLLHRGQFADAERHFRRAVERLTERNPNPYDGEAYYNLGLSLKYQGRLDQAYDAFYKATWNYAWRSSAEYALATIDCAQGRLTCALDHLDASLTTNAHNLKARDLKTAALRQLGRLAEANALVEETVASDRLDFWALSERALLSADPAGAHAELFARMHFDTQTCLDIAIDYADAGLNQDAIGLLERFLQAGGAGHPMILYALAYFTARSGNATVSETYATRAAAASPDYCFPARVEEMQVLQWATARHSTDSRAPYYLGNLLYDKRRYEEAIALWEASVALDPTFSIPWRNLGIAYFNVHADVNKARTVYQRAFAANPADARLLYELDQLEKRAGAGPEERLARLEAHRELVDRRDDLTVEFVTLLNQLGRPAEALLLLGSRRFNPCEGGEGAASGQYVWTHTLLGRRALEAGEFEKALGHFEAARRYPENLGEGKHLLTPEHHLDFFSGLAAAELGRTEEARGFWQQASAVATDVRPMWFFRAQALAKLGRERESEALLGEMKRWAEQQLQTDPQIDYFATSLPNFLLFDDDLHKRNEIDCRFVIALADIGLRRSENAADGLRRVLALDPNHLAAQEELRTLTGERHHEAIAVGDRHGN